MAAVEDRARGVLLVHRVVYIDRSGGFVFMKGDASEAVEGFPGEQVVGRVVFHIPYAGLPLLYPRLHIALVTVLGILVTVLLYRELRG
ncbi:hypothetical protein [Aeropyrum camini]|uniref:hypothetical protein n=1 Tax=Aeropyrum camini TaxID=229980 RepID=UPI00078860F1|nr:hypothetical protein [Aeropyrum camini]